MSHLDEQGKIRFDAPVSTMNHGSLERGQGEVALRWPGQRGMYNYPLDQLARRMYEKDRLEFFCMREILFHGKELGLSMRAASLDLYFGVRFTWPYEARKGCRYVFTFQGEPPPEPPGEGMTVNDLELPDVVLINGRRFWERGFGESLFFTVDYVAPEDGPMTIALVKDTMRCWRDCEKGWNGYKAMVHPVCRGYTHLHMGLQFACEHFGPVDAAPTRGEPFELPRGMRTFRNPGVWKWVEDEEPPACEYPPVAPPDYPTDGVRYNQFHDLYLDDPERFNGAGMLWNHPERMRRLVRLSLDNGIRCFPQSEPVLQALEAEGLSDDPSITIFFSGGYIKRLRGSDDNSVEAQRARRREEGARLAAVMRRFPRAPVIYRLNEFSGCQYHHVYQAPEDRARAWPKPWYEFTQAADALNREALEEVLAEARALDASRLTVAANVQTGHLTAHPLHCGADFVLDKTIGRRLVNEVVASSRGVNMAFGRTIGMQHDAWGGLNYNRDSAREIESVHRSFFFNGADFHDAEFGSVGVDARGNGVFNKKGMAWIKVTRLAAIHPRRGRQRVQLGFLKGSDQVWGWFYPSKHTMGPRGFDGYDPADPKEYVDFDLLDIAFPKCGNWMSPNPERWMTGTPYGPCDLVPWDAPLEALRRYRVLPMLGAHRFEPEWWDRCVEYVRGGGTLVMALYQMLAPGRDRVYFKDDLSDLFGLELGEDVELRDDKTLFDRQFFISRHYNRVRLTGAEAVERLPGGDDALLTRHRLGDGEAWFFTTDRLTTVPGAARGLIERLFAAHAPVTLEPAHDWMELAISEKGNLRLITLMDHGRDRLPTDAGPDTGPYSGTATLDLARLGLPAGEYEVAMAVPDETVSRLRLDPLPHRQHGRTMVVDLKEMGAWCELILAPRGRVEEAFFGKKQP